MILAVGNVKGGVGKTTLAVNIAIARALAGANVLLIDGDEQHTASDFTETRAANVGAVGYTAVNLIGNTIKTQMAALAPNYDDVVIDVGGRNTASLRAALTAADTLLVPVQPRSFDIWALEQVADVIVQARPFNEALRVVVVLNGADSQGRENEDAAAAVREIGGLEVATVTIARRKAFADAAAFGRSVLDYTPRNTKAIEELQALVHVLYGGG